MGIRLKPIIIGRYDPEILLKTKPVRRRLSRLVVNRLTQRLEAAGVKMSPQANWDNFTLTPAHPLTNSQWQTVIKVVSETFGVDKFFTANLLTPDSARQFELAFAQHFTPQVKGATFGVRVRLRDNPWYTNKRELEAKLGSLLYPQAKGVDLERPNIWVRVWLEGHRVIFIDQGYQGPAGFPLGSSDRALVLFSGGIDSPTAAWLAAKKGLQLDFLLLTQAGDPQLEHVKQVLYPFYRRWLYPLKALLYVFPGLDVSALTGGEVDDRFKTLAFKYILYKIAYRVMAQEAIKILITGESLNQVSTQTPSNLATTQTPVPEDVLIVRPLSAFTKVETIKLARRIGTLPASEKIPEYCIRSPVGSVTSSTSQKLQKVLDKYQDRINQLVNKTSYTRIDLKKAAS